jgi:molybdopterin molybdotransferase
MTDPPLDFAAAPAVWERLRQTVEPLAPRSIPALQATGCVLAQDLRSPRPFPPFDRAVMDGFAVRSADFAGGTARLLCRGLVQAGSARAVTICPGDCIRINTGGPLPAGADAVVMVEKSSPLPNDFIELHDNPRPEQNIERAGGILPASGLVASAGEPVGPGVLAALVAAGVQSVSCFPRPRVALLATGDEIAPNDAALADGQIYDSNSVTLSGLIESAGGRPRSLGRCPDEANPLQERLRDGLRDDLLIITGGMSQGTHDLVPATLEALDIRWLVTSLDLKPGKPTRIGRSPSGVWVVGLPGNPVSCAVCFLLFARAILHGLQGLPVAAPPHLDGVSIADLPANGPRPMYHPARWSADADGRSLLEPRTWRGSGDPFGLAGANALIFRDRSVPPARAGTPVRFVPFELPR